MGKKETKKIVKDIGKICGWLAIVIFLFFLANKMVGGAEEYGKVNLPLNFLSEPVKALGPGSFYTDIPCQQIENINSEIVQKFCFQVQSHIIWIIIFAMILWVIEPALAKYSKKIKDDESFLAYLIAGDSIAFMTKWIGLGLLFMAIYSLKMMM